MNISTIDWGFFFVLFLDSTPAVQEVVGVFVGFVLGAAEVANFEPVVYSVAQEVLETA